MADAPLLLPPPRSSVEAVINANNKRARDDELKPHIKSEEKNAAAASSSSAAPPPPPPRPDSSAATTPPKDEPVCDEVVKLPPHARKDFAFIPRCSHRHPMKRCVGADEPLLCDICNTEMPPTDARWSCFPCDHDMCELCMLSRNGGAAYVQLLTEEEAKVTTLNGKLGAAVDRAHKAESKLAAAQKDAKPSKPQSSGASAAAMKKLEEKLASMEERANAAEGKVAGLEKEVAERRMRSKANLEKMYDARKERDEARSQIGAKDAEHQAEVAAEKEKAECAERQVKAARQQLACAFGEAEALEPLSLEEVEEIASLALDGMNRLHERRSQLCRDARERAAAAGVFF